jgi:sugar lactone lactonase YvrE
VTSLALALLAAIAQGPAAVPAPGSADSSRAAKVAVVEGFDLPESARWDPAQDVIFVSSINGSGTAKDGNGYVSRIRPDGTVEARRFIAGGARGVTLHAPKGMALVADTLWVADIDTLRAFHARTGAPLGAVDFTAHGALFLNDVAVGPDGSLYVTDSGFRAGADGRMQHAGPDRIFRIAPDRRVTVAVEGEALGMPNGIAWDAEGRRLLVGPLADSAAVLAWTPGDSATRVVARGPGGYDGIEPVGDGSFLISSLDARSIVRLRGATVETVIADLHSPADIGWDAKRRRVLVPTLDGNRVEIWDVRGR